MSYIGKEYKYEREENFDGFVNSLGLPEEHAQRYLQYKPSSKLVKDGDNYKYINTTASGAKESSFQPGVEFDEKINDQITVTNKYSIDGNVVTQIVKSKDTEVTFKRTYTDDELVVEIKSNKWDGVAHRYYKA